MDSQTAVPPVVAVVVTCDPGPWLEEALAALAAQDYPNLSVLVIDAASVEDPTPRIASVLPTAYVRRLPERVGFSRAANDVLAIVEGASHYLFCHDDVAPEPGTIGALVEEAFRSNAGIVSPKLVDWDHPDRLLAVGQSADKTGVAADLVDVGELDQEQHDSVRDVFCAPGGCLLVRADLFSTLKGFDPGIDLCGESLNLSWRAQVVGARVVVAPGVRVRHVEALSRQRRRGWDDAGAPDRAYALEEEHRVRTILSCYGVFHLMRVVPQALALTVAQAAVQLCTGRAAMAKATLLAWPRAVRSFDSLRAARRSVQRLRTVGDGEVRRLQTPGSANLRAFVRSTLAGEGPLPLDALTSRQAMTERLAARNWRLPAAAWALTLVLLLIGSRSLLGHALPGIGTIPVLNGGPSKWWHLWWSGWRPDGLGSAGPAPPALALLALSGTILLGGVGVLQKVLVLGPLLLGPLGASRAAKPLGSPLARAAVLVAYAAVPVPFNALAGGRWAGLVSYAAAPWVLAGLCRLGSEAPYLAPARSARLVGLGLMVAFAAALAPPLLAVAPLVGIGLLAGSALVGRAPAGVRALSAAVGATAIAVVLLFPWSLGALRSRGALFGVPLARGAAPSLADILRFHTGPVGNGVLGWGLLIAAALPLLFGRSWRLVWASRMWGVAIVCWLVAWASARGTLPLPLPAPEVLLAPAAAALALSVGLGALAFQQDLPGYRLGWRQLASMAAAAGLGLASLPAVAAAGGGRWELPRLGFGSTPSLAGGSGFRVLWIGDPRAIPSGSWQYRAGVGYATSDDGTPDATLLWPPSPAGATPLLAQDLHLVSSQLTTELGHLLAPMAVRYIVIPSQTAPAGFGGGPVPIPNDIVAGLGQQIDLKSRPTDHALLVYENAAWVPARARLTPDGSSAAAQARSAEGAQNVDLSGAVPVLGSGSFDAFHGTVPGEGSVLVSGTDSGGWHLSVAGNGATREKAFGWAMLFRTPAGGGSGSLHYDTPFLARVVLLFEMGLWVVALAFVVADQRRRRGLPAAPDAGVDLPADDESEPPLPVAPSAGAAGARRHRRVTVPDTGDDGEMWT